LGHDGRGVPLLIRIGSVSLQIERRAPLGFRLTDGQLEVTEPCRQPDLVSHGAGPSWPASLTGRAIMAISTDSGSSSMALMQPRNWLLLSS